MVIPEEIAQRARRLGVLIEGTYCMRLLSRDAVRLTHVKSGTMADIDVIDINEVLDVIESLEKYYQKNN